MAVAVDSPVRLAGRLDAGMSRWLWLVKWFLAIPHYVVLAFLWMAFVVVSVMAFFSILFAGRYPRSLFNFNVGVLRWSWRVAYYSYGALATDRYPPFTLADVEDYPARLDVAYPQHLSRGLVLVKWWLLAIPHYLVVGLFLGGATYVGTQAGEWVVQSPVTGLIGLLVVVAAVVLTVTGRYPRGVFDLVLGLNRWVYRVVAYAALMTDQYPPFRLDMGEREPVGTAVLDISAAGPPPPEPADGGRMTPGAVLALVMASLLGLGSLGLFAAGVTGVVLDQTQRDAAGYIATSPVHVESSSHAIVGSGLEIRTDLPDWLQIDTLTGEIQLRFDGGANDIFAGVARESAAAAYLDELEYDEVTSIAGGDVAYREHAGGTPVTEPAAQDIWSAYASGSGNQILTFESQDGSWVVVAMNADGTAGVDLTARLAAELPVLLGVSFVLIGAGGSGLLLSALIIYLAVRRPRLPDGAR